MADPLVAVQQHKLDERNRALARIAGWLQHCLTTLDQAREEAARFGLDIEILPTRAPIKSAIDQCAHIYQQGKHHDQDQSHP